MWVLVLTMVVDRWDSVEIRVPAANMEQCVELSQNVTAELFETLRPAANIRDSKIIASCKHLIK